MQLKGQYSRIFCGYAIIYTLSGPDGVVFYVGCTSQGLDKRLAAHIMQSKKTNSPDKKCLKIKDLGYLISIKQIDSVYITGARPKFALPEAYSKEKEWIAKYFLSGHPLTNRFPTSRIYKKGTTMLVPRKSGYEIIVT